jgi:hypothetical protein
VPLSQEGILLHRRRKQAKRDRSVFLGLLFQTDPEESSQAVRTPGQYPTLCTYGARPVTLTCDYPYTDMASPRWPVPELAVSPLSYQRRFCSEMSGSLGLLKGCEWVSHPTQRVEDQGHRRDEQNQGQPQGNEATTLLVQEQGHTDWPKAHRLTTH